MADIDADDRDRLRDLTEHLLAVDTSGGNEAPAQRWLRERLDDLGFETYEWTADADALAGGAEFPAASELDVDGRPSVSGALELGNPDAGPTLVLNGHVDVVPASASLWTGDPFDPRWEGDRLVARGAADMKSQLAALIVAARAVADDPGDIDGRLVVESVAGEEDGGIGAAAAAATNPYPFERNAAVVAEPTDWRVVTATEGCLMARIEVEGTPAHAARRWEGASVLPAFERVRAALRDLEADRAERVTHPLYDRFETPWPIVIGRVEAGTWASNVPGTLTADLRGGVAPGESLDAVEAECRAAVEAAVAGEPGHDGEGADDESAPLSVAFERFGVQFESAEIDADEPVVAALREALDAAGRERTAPVGETYGSDARHYVGAGIPTVVFGPGRIEEAHFPDESIAWPEVVAAAEVYADTARRFLSGQR